MASRSLPACYLGFVASTFDRLADLAPERVRPLKRVEFERLVDAGVFDDERVELLGGAIVEMSPQHPRHAATVARLNKILTRIAGDQLELRPQLPLAASDDSLPEPDFALVPLGDHDHAHPSHALLVVEVADSSLRKDRLLKAELYAHAGVPEYWIVNLADRAVEVHTNPRDGIYSKVRSVEPDAAIRLVALPDVEVLVADFLK
jgi:Uma2 family endonuclease